MQDETMRRLHHLDQIIYDVTTERPFFAWDENNIPTQAGLDAAKVLERGVVYVKDSRAQP